MKEFLHKYVYITIKKPERVMQHKCAKVTNISETHISLLDIFDGQPYFYRIIDIIEIKLSNKNPKEFGGGEDGSR